MREVSEKEIIETRDILEESEEESIPSRPWKTKAGLISILHYAVFCDALHLY